MFLFSLRVMFVITIMLEKNSRRQQVIYLVELHPEDASVFFLFFFSPGTDDEICHERNMMLLSHLC